MDYFNTQNLSQFKKPKNIFGVKLIFIILGIIVLAETVYAVWVFLSPTSPLPAAKTTVQQAKTAGEMSLLAPKTTVLIKEVIPVTVIVDSGGHMLSGADLIVRFDPKVLEATAGGLVKGQIFSEYPLLSVDAQKGLVAISGVNNLNSGFTGRGQFASINFKAKSTGKTSVTIDFQPGSTTSSNLVEASTIKSILGSVVNVELEVQ